MLPPPLRVSGCIQGDTSVRQSATNRSWCLSSPADIGPAALAPSSAIPMAWFWKSCLVSDLHGHEYGQGKSAQPPHVVGSPTGCEQSTERTVASHSDVSSEV